MPDPTSTPSGAPEGSPNLGSSSLYLQHPDSLRLDEQSIISGTAFVPMSADEAVASVYELLQKPRTLADLVSALVTQRGLVVLTNSEVADRIEPILQAMVEHGLVIEIPPGGPMPSDAHGSAKRFLYEAQQRLCAGDWSAAVTLCQEAGKDQAFTAVAELNTLIARYHGDSLDGMVEQACMLSPRLTGASQACCDALALLVAQRTGDLTTAKLIALHLGRRYKEPWDLPTVPSFAFQVRDQVIVLESRTAERMLSAIEGLLSADVSQADETALLQALAKRYRERQDG